MNFRKSIFIAILVTPALIIAAILALTLRDILVVNEADPALIYEGLREHLARKEPVSFPLPEQILERDAAKKTVFVFGESSLVLSDSGLTFPDYLQLDHPELRVLNLGVSGIDSFSIRQRFVEALSLARPDIVILYYGHNDYNNAYQGYIIPRHFEEFNALLRLAHLFYDEERPVSAFSSGDIYWFSRLNRPRIMHFFERIGLVRVDHRAYAKINKLILDRYIENTEAMIALAARHRIPVVLITPVGNLRAVPYGDRMTTALYRKGTGVTDYRGSLASLKAARDAELFTYDLRAKSGISEYLRTMRRQNVHVLDLESRLESLHFEFGYSDFLDYFHFNDGSHRRIADCISEHLLISKLARKSMKTPP